MEYNIYCDESCHLEHDDNKIMVLGGVWCQKSEKDKAFKELRELKSKYGLKPTNELKWNAVSESKIDYYKDVLNYYFNNESLHFRALVVPDKNNLNHEAYHQTHDEFYYKMYFDMLKALIDPRNIYNIYLDIKDTQGGRKVERLKDVLCNNALDFDKKCINKIQQIKSHEVELLELADFLIGAVAYVNRGLQTSTSKLELIHTIKEKTNYSLTKSTLLREEKMNIFIWNRRNS